MQDPLFDLPSPPPKRARRPAAALTPVTDAQPRPCKFCGAWVVPAYTQKGAITMANFTDHLNHWITCAKRDTARDHYAKQRRRK